MWLDRHEYRKPHIHVYHFNGTMRVSPEYDTLSPTEFAAGVIASLLASSDSQEERERQLRHLHRVMMDAEIFEWALIRN